MNLQNASKHHRNIVSSLAGLFCFAYIAGIEPGKTNNSIVVAIVIFVFIFQIISFFLLAKALDKNKILWTVSSILGPYLIFVPYLFLIFSANKVFKTNGWKVKFYGGAVKKNTDL
jgi:hypothetical protein